MCVKLHTVSKITHCVQKYTVRSLFRVNCEEKKFPSVNLFYTSTAIDAMDKYQVWLKVIRIITPSKCHIRFTT